MEWDEVFDVVVVGSGIAGVATALAASALGLRPVLIEKAGKLGGGTSFSMGGIWIGNNHLARDAGYRDSRREVLDYMRFIAADEADQERLLAYVDRGPEALKFFEDLGIQFRISRGLTDHYFGVAPGSLAEGRCLNTDFIAATDLGDWQDSILAPRDTPIEVNSEELFKWGGHRQFRQLAEGHSGGAPQKQGSHPRRRRHHPFRQATAARAAWRSAPARAPSAWRSRTAASPASSPTRA